MPIRSKSLDKNKKQLPQTIKSFSGGPGGRFFKKAPLAAGGNSTINMPLFLSIMILLFQLHAPSLAGGKIVVRPSFEKIHPLMVKGWSLLKKRTRKNVALAIKILDSLHSRFLIKNGFSTSPPSGLKERIRTRTGVLPRWIPGCERTIIFSLFIQLDMLDAVLKIKDSKKAGEVKEERSKKRILSRDNKIYGDYRDVYFYKIIDTLKDISEVHRCFGVEGNIDFSFPRGLKKTETASYILTKIESVSKQAEKLLRIE